MSNNYFADITNKLYEEGILKEKEKVIDIINNYILLERFTGKSFVYRMCDLDTLKSHYLGSRQKQLSTGSESVIYKKISDFEILDAPSVLKKTKEQRAIELLSYIFTDVLPQHKFSLREEQRKLSLAMLMGLQRNEISLCEAEVGTGKTHAYILAVIVHNLFTDRKMSTVISTSTIALQKALTEEYIPQISEILMEHRIINKPLSFIVRKGKSHYLCENRCKGFLKTAKTHYPNEPFIENLSQIAEGNYGIEIANFPYINTYIKKRIAVEHCKYDCGFRENCSYQRFLNVAMKEYFDFHITNHNFLLADLLVRKKDRQLLPKYGQVVVDEAHKLSMAVQNMYSEVLDELEMEQLIYKVSRLANKSKETNRIYVGLVNEKTKFFNHLRAIKDTIESEKIFCNNIIKVLNDVIEYFSRNSSYVPIYLDIKHTATKLMDKIHLMRNEEDWVLRLKIQSNDKVELSALPKHLGALLNADFWDKDVPIILTSGTMSVDGDFSHLKRKNGIYVTNKISETRTKSPFDYHSNALLYLPKTMPYPDVVNEEYKQALLFQITELIRLTYGHTLVLFTSYKQMEQMFIEVQNQITDFPLYMMSKGKLNILNDFRDSRNGVLFASDSAGEGIDLAGDIVSSVIVVKLPFPVPDPMSEYELSSFDEFRDYLEDTIIPTMLIKLRQWVGRGIRRESDSCVFSILDARANKRYKNDIVNALPSMPVTQDILDVGRFILNKKENQYFL